MPTWIVYCHTHVESGRRYVGVTKKTLLQRWNQHVYTANREARGWSHFANAIRAYGKGAFSHEILETHSSLESANEAEIRFVSQYGTRDPKKGFNFKRGGDHRPHPVRNPWDRPEYREKCSKNIVHCLTPEAREKQLASLRSPESRTKRSALTKVSMNSPEVVAKRRVFQGDPAYRQMISETTKAGLADPAVREKVSAGLREMWKDPEVRDRLTFSLKEAGSRPEVRSKLSKRSRASWDDPEVRARREAAFRADAARPEKKALLSKAALGRRHAPEAVARMRELYLQRSSSCKFCGSVIEGKRTCINGRVSCAVCYSLHKSGLASFRRPDGAFL